jgi:hypothetical protein
LIIQSDESGKPIIEVAEDAPRELAEADATGENQGELRVSYSYRSLLRVMIADD